ncbi:hypothetical protein HDV63DRAFT_370610 [Trichoderma sp. SZMC 28014]
MAVVEATPSTPPAPSSSIRTPPAPRLGYHDSWEPYSPPRKSARLSAQRVSARTPSPQPATRQAISSPRAAAKSAAQSSAAMASPISSPRKKRQPAADSVRRVAAALATESAAPSGSKDKSVAGRAVAASSLMLPTPSKTPQKPPTSKETAEIQSFARNLFPAEDADVSSPRKRRSKKYSSIALEGFRAEVEEDIEIFTDSQERIPKKDDSKLNPFVGNATSAEPSKRRTKRKVMVPGEGAQSVDEAARRDDGLIYVFRGKKFFRKFSEFDDEVEDEELDSDVEAHFSKPLTRSSIKPRLLFPTKAPAPKTKQMLEDEEAATDVEDAKDGTEAEEPSAPVETPVKAKEERAQTPEAPKYAPASPPETRRTTRSTNKLAAAPTPAKRAGKKSPFDSWLRTKESANRSGTKRAAGEPLAAAPAKRTRS